MPSTFKTETCAGSGGGGNPTPATDQKDGNGGHTSSKAYELELTITPLHGIRHSDEQFA